MVGELFILFVGEFFRPSGEKSVDECLRGGTGFFCLSDFVHEKRPDGFPSILDACSGGKDRKLARIMWRKYPAQTDNNLGQTEQR